MRVIKYSDMERLCLLIIKDNAILKFISKKGEKVFWISSVDSKGFELLTEDVDIRRFARNIDLLKRYYIPVIPEGVSEKEYWDEFQKWYERKVKEG